MAKKKKNLRYCREPGCNNVISDKNSIHYTRNGCYCRDHSTPEAQKDRADASRKKFEKLNEMPPSAKANKTTYGLWKEVKDLSKSEQQTLMEKRNQEIDALRKQRKQIEKDRDDGEWFGNWKEERSLKRENKVIQDVKNTTQTRKFWNGFYGTPPAQWELEEKEKERQKRIEAFKKKPQEYRDKCYEYWTMGDYKTEKEFMEWIEKKKKESWEQEKE